MANSDYSIGVVGVGRMGGNIARHLKDEGFSVRSVYDVRSDAAQELAAEIGAEASDTLAGVTAALTRLPVLGVPLDSSALNGLDSLLATVQMPGGIPVATFGIGKSGAKNAGLFAGAILANSDARVRRALLAYRKRQTEAVPQRP